MHFNNFQKNSSAELINHQDQMSISIMNTGASQLHPPLHHPSRHHTVEIRMKGFESKTYPVTVVKGGIEGITAELVSTRGERDSHFCNGNKKTRKISFRYRTKKAPARSLRPVARPSESRWVRHGTGIIRKLIMHTITSSPGHIYNRIPT